ncbi:hypothetical protein CLF_107580 [Clonorchis sinensis]|uniref:Uncharacterized protein n=1 Tax=Clonorchis sinensis TaxID=79923 RepID=G7YQU6_CLOSI|nr:hypothetical protein CLF_107580 [Clonorchis sinensis]
MATELPIVARYKRVIAIGARKRRRDDFLFNKVATGLFISIDCGMHNSADNHDNTIFHQQPINKYTAKYPCIHGKRQSLAIELDNLLHLNLDCPYYCFECHVTIDASSRCCYTFRLVPVLNHTRNKHEPIPAVKSCFRRETFVAGQRNSGSKRNDSLHRYGRDHLIKAPVHGRIADHRSARETECKNNPPEQRGPSLLCLWRALIYDKCAWAPTCNPTFTMRTSDWLVTQLRTFGSRIKPDY